MIAAQNQPASKDSLTLSITENASENLSPAIKDLSSSKLALLPGRTLVHHPQAGLNPIVDAASYLFSALGKLKHLPTHRNLAQLQHELIDEINLFQETIQTKGYNAELLMVCRYILCATFDDILSNTAWGSQNQWESYALLAAFNQDQQHHDKFFVILDRALKEQSQYIDLMELIYICLSMGYKGQYRSTEHNQYQLEKIIDNLYRHIRTYRGNFNKTLSPTPLKTQKANTSVASTKLFSVLSVYCMAACIIMMIFVSLGYLMDIIANENFQNISQIKNTALHETS